MTTDVTTEMTAHGAPLRVLAWPARRKRGENPYSFLVQDATRPHGVATSEFGLLRLLRPGWDVIHIHWPELALLRRNRVLRWIACSVLLALLRYQKILGARLVWTCHNLAPHETPDQLLANLYLRTFARLQDGYLSPSAYGLGEAAKLYPSLAGLPCAVSAIGHYRDEYPPPVDGNEVRARWGVAEDQVLIVSIGQIRAYKGLADFAALVADAHTDRSWHYVIVGAGKDPDEVDRLTRLADQTDRITFVPTHIENQAVSDLLSAADLFAAPFRTASHSSSVVLALSFGCRVVAPALPSLEEMKLDVGDGWIETYEGPPSVSFVVDVLDKPAPPSPPDLTAHQWDVIGAKTARLFHRVVLDERAKVTS